MEEDQITSHGEEDSFHEDSSLNSEGAFGYLFCQILKWWCISLETNEHASSSASSNDSSVQTSGMNLDLI